MKKTITAAIAALAAGVILIGGAGQAAALAMKPTAGGGATQAQCDDFADRLNRLGDILEEAILTDNDELADRASDGFDNVMGQARDAGCEVQMDGGAVGRPDIDGWTTDEPLREKAPAW